MAKAWDLIEPCFLSAPAADGRLLHPAIEAERARRNKNHKARSAAGALGAQKRWGAPRDSAGTLRGPASGHAVSPSPAVSPLPPSLPAPAAAAPPASVEPAARTQGESLNGEAERRSLRWHGPDRGSGTGSGCPQTEVIALYHTILPTCPKVLKWGPRREPLLRGRWREMALHENPELGAGYKTRAEGLAWWRKFFVHCANSRLLTGRAESRRPGEAPFVATLEWIVRPSNFTKILEGNYNREGVKR